PVDIFGIAGAGQSIAPAAGSGRRAVDARSGDEAGGRNRQAARSWLLAFVVERWMGQYLTALTPIFAILIHFINGKGRGRPKQPQVAPDPRCATGKWSNGA